MARRVGIVSSVALPVGPGTLFNALTGPITAAGHIIATPETAGGDYDVHSKREMRRAVRKLLNPPAPTPNPDMVIAVGGLVAARAVSDYFDAHENQALPFLICVGRAPNEGSTLWENDQFMGGINLDSANQNTTRATLLMKKNPGLVSSVNEICLYYNKNSHMAAREAKEWSFFGLLKESSVDHNAANTAGQFRDDFKTLPRGTKAVIVSSDPFFASKASEVTAAALAEFAGKPVCYPNALYPVAGQPLFMIYGANLAAAYDALGKKAVGLLALAKPRNQGLDTPLPETVNGPP